MKDQYKYLIFSLTLCASMLIIRRQYDDEQLKRVDNMRMLSEWKKEYCTSSQDSIFSETQRKQYRPEGKDISQNRVSQYLVDQDIDSLQTYYIQQFSPWLVMAIVLFFGFIYGIAFISLDFKPLCLYRNRNYKKKPLQKGELIYPIVALIVFNCLTLGVCVSGVAFSQKTPAFIQELQCAVGTSVYKSMNGEGKEKGFVGLSKLDAEVKRVSDEVKETVDKLETQVGSTTWVATDGDALKTEQNKIYTDHKDTQILKPNPIYISSGGSLQSYQNSYFLKYLVGPAANSETLLNQIDKGVMNKARMVADLTSNIKTSIGQVQTKLNSNDLPQSLSKAQSDNQLLLTQVQLLDSSIRTKMSTLSGYQSIIEASSVVMIISGITGLVSIIVCILVFTCNASTTTSNKMRRLFHAIWILFNLSAIITLVVVGGLWALSGAVYDTCLAMDHMFFSQTHYQKYPNLFNQQIQNNLPVCLWKNDGKFQRNLGVEAELNTIGEITSSYANFIAYMSVGDAQYLDLSQKELTTFAEQNSRVEKYFLGAKVNLNSESPSMTDDNPVVALSNLNTLSDKSQPYAPSNGCQVSQDYYVYDLNDCPNNYQLFNNLTHTISFNYGQKTCIQIQQMYKTNFQSRNSPYQTQCSTKYTSLANYYYAIYNFDQSNREAFFSLQKALALYSTNSKAYIQAIQTKYTTLNTLNSKTTLFVSFFNTLMSQLNCNFLEKYIQSSLDLLCIGVGENLYKTVSMMTISAFCLVVNTILAYVFATRFDKFKVIKLNPNKNIYLRKSQRLSMSQTKYLEDISDLDKDLNEQQQFHPQNLELTHFQTKPSSEMLINQAGSNNELKSGHTEDIKEDEQELADFDSIKKDIN